MINGSCHCGAVKFKMLTSPNWLTSCNCSICRRLGALWAHGEISDITIECQEGATSRYIQGDKTLAIHTCVKCGCTSHWENLIPDQHTRMAVNCRLAEPEMIAGIRVRPFDGAETWKFLDQE